MAISKKSSKGRRSKLLNEYMDQDYLDKLTKEEANFVLAFNEEYYRGNVKHGKSEVQTKSKKKIKEAYRRQYMARNDIFGLKNNIKKLVSFEELREKVDKRSLEDFVVDQIDKKRRKFSV